MGYVTITSLSVGSFSEAMWLRRQQKASHDKLTACRCDSCPVCVDQLHKEMRPLLWSYGTLTVVQILETRVTNLERVELP